MAKKDVNNKDKTSFMKSFKAELKKVVWPTPKQLFNNTVAVLAIVIVTTIIVFVLDFTFETMNNKGINRIKNVISNSNVVNNETTSSANENETDEILQNADNTNTETPVENTETFETQNEQTEAQSTAE